MTRSEISQTQLVILGFIFIPGIIALSTIQSFSISINITLVILVASIFWSLFNIKVFKLLSRRLPLSIIFLLLFSATGIIRVLIDLEALASLPLTYVLHTASLLIGCPVAAIFGYVFIKYSDQHTITLILWVSIAATSIFLIVDFILPPVFDSRGSYYQYIGDSLSVIVILTSMKTLRTKDSFLWLVGGIFIALSGSRASLLAFLLSMFFAGGWVRLVLTLVFFVFITYFALTPVLMFLIDNITGYRVISTLGNAIINGSIDNSLSERIVYLEDAKRVILDSPILGQYGYDYKLYGNGGSYAHSIITVISQLGIVPFFFLVASIAICSFTYTTDKNKSRYIAFDISPLFVFLLVQLFLFRHPESIPLFFAIGCLVASGRKRCHNAPGRTMKSLAAKRPPPPMSL